MIDEDYLDDRQVGVKLKGCGDCGRLLVKSKLCPSCVERRRLDTMAPATLRYSKKSRMLLAALGYNSVTPKLMGQTIGYDRSTAGADLRWATRAVRIMLHDGTIVRAFAYGNGRYTVKAEEKLWVASTNRGTPNCASPSLSRRPTEILHRTRLTGKSSPESVRPKFSKPLDGSSLGFSGFSSWSVDTPRT
jgi:hypothetical protein